MLTRILIVALAGLFFVLALVTFFNYAGSSTDENLFQDEPARVAVLEAFPAIPLYLAIPSSKNPSEKPTDSVRVADILLDIANRTVNRIQDAKDLESSISPDSALVCVFKRQSTGQTLFGVVSLRRLTGTGLCEIPSGVKVVSVVEGGASDRAGMLVGDLIFRINGKTFANSSEADRLMSQGPSGRSIAYDVYRGIKPLTLNVVLARFGFPLSSLTLSLSGIIFLLVGSFIAWKSVADHGGRLVGLSFVLLGFVMSVFIIRKEPETNFFVAFRNIAMLTSLFVGQTIAWHSSLLFPDRHAAFQRNSRPIRVMYIVAGISVLFFLVAPGTMTKGLLALIILDAILVILGAAIRWRYHGTAGTEFNSRRRYIRIASIATSILVALVVAILAITHHGEQAGFIGAILLLLPASTLYTIGRYRLLGITLKVRRTLSYSLVNVIWIVVFINVTIAAISMIASLPIKMPLITYHLLSVEIIDSPDIGGNSTSQKMVLIGLGLVTVGGLTHLQRKVRKGIDNFFDRTGYDYRKALEDFGAMLSNNLGMSSLAHGIVEATVDMMKVKRAGILFFRNGEECCCRESAGVPEAEWAGFCLHHDQEFVLATAGVQGPIPVRTLPERDRRSFEELGLRYLIPIRSKERLIAVLALGEKLSEASYTDEDIDFLSAIGKQASVAIENTFLYEELAGQERLKMELGIARRIQLASLPQVMPQVPGYNISGVSIPAMEVGGDFFDFLQGIDGNLIALIGDVSGKGTSAALYMAKVQGIFRSLNSVGGTMKELMSRANRLLRGDIARSSFVTVLAVNFDRVRQTATVIRAGNVPLFHFEASTGKVHRIVPTGLALGMDDGTRFDMDTVEQEIRLNTKDVYIFVSDGVTEARDVHGVEFGEERLTTIISASVNRSASEIQSAIVRSVESFVGEASPHDDQTIVVVKVT